MKTAKSLQTGLFTLLLFCGVLLHGQTIQWLPLPADPNLPGTIVLQPNPLGANGPGTWIVTNLGCYGHVLITQTSPVGANDFMNPLFENVPANGAGVFENMETGFGPYSWGYCGGLGFQDSSARDNYTVNFYFLDGDPVYFGVVLGAMGLGESTVATVSQPVVFRGEWDLPGSAFTAITNQPYNITATAGSTNAGTIGTIIGSHYNIDTNGDILNTGFGIFQLVSDLQTTNLPSGSAGFPTSSTRVPYLSLTVSQEQGDGMGFTLGYICLTNICSNSCVSIYNPADITVFTCSNCAVVNFTAEVVDSCCSHGLTTNYSVQPGSCFPIGMTTVTTTASDGCGNSNSCSFHVTVIHDSSPPVIVSAPASITSFLLVTNCCVLMDDVTSEVQAQALGGGPVTVTQSIPYGTYLCTNTNVVFTVSDICGNSTNITVPVILPNCATNCLQIQCWSNIVVTSCTNVTVEYFPSATDLCCSNWFTYCDPASGSSFSPGTTTTVFFVAVDPCGNSNGCTFTVTVLQNTNPPIVQGLSNILVYSCTNVAVDYPQPVVTDPCCGTNWSVVFEPPSGTSFAAGKAGLVNWSLNDCSGTNVATGSFWVSVYCTNCCQGPVTNYTVTVVKGSNYLADCLCQGTTNTLADVLPNVPVGTQVYFWNPNAGQFAPPDTFTSGGWQDGTEPLFPGEGFLLVSFTNQYSLTIYGSEPGCGGGCSTLNCSSPTLLAGDYGINPNPVPFCNLFCCAPPFGTEVRVWDATSQSFTIYVYGAPWSPSLPPPLPVGYSEFVSVETGFPVINCPGDIVTNSCAPIPVIFTVTNAFGDNLTAAANPPSGSVFNVGTTTVHCAATNACGGISTCSFTVTVNCVSPVINVVRSGGSWTLNWLSNQGYMLESQTNLFSQNGWTTVTNAADGSFTLNPNKPAQFFRLKHK
jgi:hypothetical protein